MSKREWTTIKEYEDIRFEFFEGIAKITIDRQEVYNAFRPQTNFEMLDAMNILLLDEAVDFADAEAADLASLFLKVCQTQHNFTVMTNEMDRTYSELMKE